MYLTTRSHGRIVAVLPNHMRGLGKVQETLGSRHHQAHLARDLCQYTACVCLAMLHGSKTWEPNASDM